MPEVRFSALAINPSPLAEHFRLSFPGLTRKYHSGFAHDAGMITDFKGWFWNGNKIKDPNFEAQEIMESVGWKAASAERRKVLAYAWAREVLWFSSEETLEQQRPAASYLPGFASDVLSQKAQADPEATNLSLWLINTNTNSISYIDLCFSGSGMLQRRSCRYLGTVSPSGFHVYKHASIPTSDPTALTIQRVNRIDLGASVDSVEDSGGEDSDFL